MADIQDEIEVLENRLMRGWMHGNESDLKTLITGECLMMFGTAPPVLLDRPSFIAGLERGFNLTGFRFQEVTSRQYGGAAWFTGHVEMEMRVAGKPWSGNFLITDLWLKKGLRKRWKLAERSLAAVEANKQLSDAIRALQLWR